MKAKERSAPASAESDADSLDFSHIGPAKAPAPAKDAKPVGPKAGGSRRLAVPVLIIVTVVLVIAYATTERSSKELVTPAPSAAPTSPAREPQQSSPSPEARTPPSRANTQPPPGSTPQRTPIPAEFLKAFEDYATKSGGKAIALALDRDGRSAYVIITGYRTQSQATEEAMSECMRHKIQTGVQESCRLYAVGDKVVW